MATIGRRFKRAWCPRCDDTRDFRVLTSWRLRCPECGHERGLRREAPARAEPALAR